jgi:acetate---CoA ligase (ADP-forming)
MPVSKAGSTAYPHHREADIALRDGSTVHVRPIRADDVDAVRRFLGGLSMESRASRFFSAGADLDRAAEQAVAVDYRDRYGLVATLGRDGRVVGNAIYARIDPTQAEAAFAVSDDFQGHGLGTILLAHLAEAAREAGILVFVNQVLPENHRMIEVFRESGFPVQTRAMPGYVEIEVPTSLTPDGLERFMGRDRTSAAAAMESFLRPSSVAVIGASRRRGTIGGEIFHNLLVTGFNGPLYPVNPTAPVVQSVPASARVTDVPGPVDLAIVVVPGPRAREVLRDCGEKGVRAIVMISAGFAETGSDGLERQREVLAICREFGMRLIGPNCMGIMNTDPTVLLNATFAPGFPPRGTVGFLSQSGGLGLAVIDRAAGLGMGISSFVSVGNKADISGNDVIQYWEQDPTTDVILLYLESFGNPRNFARIARRVARTKPIVAVKSGRSTAGARATTSHTGALIAASDVTVDALFRQSGVIRTDTLSELFDVASVLANQPVPKGGRVGIITNGGGPGILCADACEAHGLTVAPLPDEVQTRLRGFLSPDASVVNPVDMIASAKGEAYRRTIELIAGEGDVDAMVVIFVPPLVTSPEEVAEALGAVADELHGGIPILSVFMSTSGVPEALRRSEGHRAIPTFAFPEEAARALAHVVRYGQWRSRPEGSVPELPGIDQDTVAATIAEALRRGGSWLTPQEVERVLSCYGLPVAASLMVGSARAAGLAAEELGGPVALKAMARDLVHKTDAGGVRLGLTGRTRVARAAGEIRTSLERAGHRLEGFLVQRMVGSGVEMLVGVVHDPLFGPVVAVGAGGTAVELIKDVEVRLTPLTDLDASEMIRSLATFPLLDGYRGAPKAGIAALEDMILRVGALVEAHAEITEMDLNPVMALQDSAVVVDARIRVEAAPASRPLLARRSI